MSFNTVDMDAYCGSDFWDDNGPYISECFERSVLVWIPNFFIYAFITIEISYLYNSNNKNVPRNWLNTSKLIGSFCCLLLAIIDLGYAIYLVHNFKNTFPVDFAAPIIQIFGFCISTGLIEANRRRGLRTSGLLVQFWFLYAICGAFRFRSLILNKENQERTLLFYTYMISYPIIVIESLLHIPADKEPLIVDPPINKNTCPEKQASFLSRITFSWFDSMAWKGYKNPLDLNDMWEAHPKEKSYYLVKHFNKFWKEALSKRKHKNKKIKSASIIPVLFRAFGHSFYFGAFLKLISDITGFFNPILLQLLINFVWSTDPDWYGYSYALALFINVSLTTFILSQYFQRMFTVGLRIRATLISTIYRKALRLSSGSRKDTTVGEIVNLMSADAQKFMDLIVYVNMIWSNPLQFGLCFYLLWIKLGPSVFAGLIVLLLLLPVDAIIASVIRKQQIKQMKFKDIRVKFISEIISGIKVLKLNAWEKYFEDKISNIRDEEIKELKKTAYYDAANSFIWNFAPILVSVVSFTTFVLSNENNVLDADTAFVSLTLFNMMRYSLTMFPVMITSLVQLSVAVKRINKFLNLEEIDNNIISHEKNDETPICIENGSFSWGNENNLPTLKNISLKIGSGELIGIIGTVGSGKSSLLSSIIGDLNKTNGNINTYGEIAYVPQQSWILNTSLKDNILFGKTEDKIKYDTIIKACALKPDINILPAGDLTEIGEKGINLSGGQKQRISLARAVYNNSDIYLLDDPLSAVDSTVAKYLFDNVIGPNGLLKNKTRVFVTNSITNLSDVDKIIVMKNGEIIEEGNYNQLIDKKGDFAELVKQFLTEKTQNNDEASEEEKEEEKIPNKKENKLIEAEKAETGNIGWDVYSHYLTAVGLSLAVFTLVFNIFQHSTGVISNFWLSKWSSEQTNTSEILTDDEEIFYLSIYGLLGAIQAIFVLIPTIILVIGGVRASVKLHKKMLGHTLRNPLEFFDTTPTGRIINRFSKDIDVVDNYLPVTIRTWLSSFLTVVSTLVVISITNYWFLIFIIPIGILYFIIQRFYIPTSRQLKRLESTSRSPIYSHFGESLTGVSSIRAYNCYQRFILESERKVDINQMPYYLTIIANRWLAIRLEMLGNFIILFAGLLSVISRDTMSPGTVGLSVSYALQITSTLNFLVRTTSDIETNIVAVERIKEYGETKEEYEWEIEETRPKYEWPIKGSIEFKNYEMRYREGLDLVLKKFTCLIKGGQKVGIVGRTGAGKSSIVLGLFRIIEASSGSILIDEIEISKLGLHDLRKQLTIIPQDPVLFSGSLRANIDPLNLHSDDQIWRILELTHLKTFVTNNSEEGLFMNVGENGENLSVGQRQLVCLARAMLRKTKILILDEATGAIDLQTDDLIQKTIREEFKECTVLTIAHRLNTIMDSDRILLLEQGHLVEDDTPENLLNNVNSKFTAMVKDAGIISQ